MFFEYEGIYISIAFKSEKRFAKIADVLGLGGKIKHLTGEVHVVQQLITSGGITYIKPFLMIFPKRIRLMPKR